MGAMTPSGKLRRRSGPLARHIRLREPENPRIQVPERPANTRLSEASFHELLSSPTTKLHRNIYTPAPTISGIRIFVTCNWRLRTRTSTSSPPSAGRSDRRAPQRIATTHSIRSRHSHASKGSPESPQPRTFENGRCIRESHLRPSVAGFKFELISAGYTHGCPLPIFAPCNSELTLTTQRIRAILHGLTTSPLLQTASLPEQLPNMPRATLLLMSSVESHVAQRA